MSVLKKLIGDQRSGWTNRISRIDEDDIKALARLGEKTRAIVDLELGAWIGIGAVADFGQVAQRHLDDSLIDLDFERAIDAGVHEHMPQGATVAATDDQHAMRVRMCEQRNVHERLVVGELFVQAGLKGAGQNE